MVKRTERRQLILEIDKLAHLPPESVPEDSKFLLEIDFSMLRSGDIFAQHYWIHSIKAAVASERRKTFLQRRRGAAPS